MAFSNGYITGSEVTEPEVLLSDIVVRHPSETPLIATLPTFRMANRVIEWSLDRPFTSSDGVRNIAAPHTNTRREAAEWTTQNAHYPIRPRCIAEIKHFGFQISRSDMLAKLAGVDSTFDYRAAQLSTKLLNEIETTLMYGQGSPTTDGSTDERRTMGLLFASAVTGLERMAGSTLDAITDPYGVSIPSDFWSVFFNANRTPLSRRMLYNKVMATILRAGGRMETPWIFHVGFSTAALVADFLTDPSGNPINNRDMSAESDMGYDYIAWMKMPSGHRVGFRTNRYLDQQGTTFTIDNSDYTPGAPASPGTVGATTLQGDQTIVGYEPGTVSLGWYDPPHFVNVPTTGDYVQLQAVAEFGLRVKAPLCVAGIGNCGG